MAGRRAHFSPRSPGRLINAQIFYNGAESSHEIQAGERFAVVDQYGLVKVLTPEEVELTKAFNPKLFETRAFGVKYFKEAPAIPPLPVSPEQQ